MATFKHSGDLGDIIYSLPTIRALGGGILYLSLDSDATRFNIKTYKMLKPLLLVQPYIEQVKLYSGIETIDYDLDKFRLTEDIRHTNLADAHLLQFNLQPKERYTKWLNYVSQPNNKVIIARSMRHRNDKFKWKELLNKYPEAVFIGTNEDHKDFEKLFGKIERLKVKTFLDIAQAINSSKLFIGNQSFPYSITEGLKKEAILEVCESVPNCMFKREGLDNDITGNNYN